MVLQENGQIPVLRSKLFTLFTCVFFAGIVMGEKAPALLSIGMAGQVLSILLLTHPKKLFQAFIKEKSMWIFSISFLFLLLSFFYSTNLPHLLERLKIKVPFLAYALIWPSIGLLSKKQKQLIFYAFTGIVSLTALGILINYLLHFDEINQLYLESKIMPGPINHIRFSLLVVFAICFIYHHIRHELLLQSSVHTKILTGVGIFLMVFLHIYSVRSGLLALYAILFIALINYVVTTKNFKHVMVSMLVIVGIGISSFMISPTMRNKLINTQQDVNVYTNAEDPNYNSLATRMVSYKTGLEIFKEHALFGCGQGDIEDLNAALFKRDYPSVITPIIPHNQFIYYLAATGIVGLIIFALSFTAPLWVNGFYKFEFMQLSYATLILAFQFEAMIETQVGVATTIVMVFIPYYFCKYKTTITASPYK